MIKLNIKDKEFLMQKKIQKLINNISEVYVNDMFNDFYYHSEYRGENFAWKKFPVMVAKIVSASSYMYFIDWKLYSDNLKQSIKDAVYNKALTLAEEKVKTVLGFK